MERDTNNFEQEEHHRIEGLVSPGLVPFVTAEKTGEFVKGHFKPGPVKVQEGMGEEKTNAPVSIEYQEKLLSLLPWVLTQMCVDRIPINPPEKPPTTGNLSEMTADQLSQLKHAYSKTPKQEHITELLRPERLKTPYAQRSMEHLTSSEENRYLLPFGHRIWGKLVRKAMTTTGSAREMIHPIKSLQTYPGLIIGAPDRKPDSYIDLIRITNHISVQNVINLMLYEIENGLADENDLKEINILACGNPQFATGLRKSGNLISLIRHVPLTKTLLNGSLKLDEEDVVNILAYKFSIGKFDNETIESIKIMMENEDCEYVKTFISSHEGIMALIQKTEEKDRKFEGSLIEKTKAKARADLQNTLDQSMNGFSAKLDRDEVIAKKAREEDDPPPTAIKASEFNLEDWQRHDDVVIIQDPDDELR
ncbi:MAG: hypothetical protein ACD_65C00374G0002 [uncultured bacterium]|nr:MAG: hypothetical protein ACD_65C00374G0002 [uncultured bacterium]